MTFQEYKDKKQELEDEIEYLTADFVEAIAKFPLGTKVKSKLENREGTVGTRYLNIIRTSEFPLGTPKVSYSLAEESFQFCGLGEEELEAL